jgi:hypothetical protein
MAERYLGISPYTYCANNPINFIDLDGMKITGDTAAVNQVQSQAQKGANAENKTQARLQAKANKRTAMGKSTTGLGRRVANSEFREEQYQSTVDEIGVLKNSSTIYNVNTNYTPTTSDGTTEYTGTDANGNYIINLNVSQSYANNGGLAHGLVHGYQFETGQVDFQSTGSPALLYDITDEMAAFTRQFVFTNNSQMYNVSVAYVGSIPNKQGLFEYRKLPNGPLNINSTFGILFMRYSQINMPIVNLLPSNLKTIYLNAHSPYIYKGK